MRKLTIKRRKSFVGCLAKMKVYIEDAASGELVINDVPCKKLGVLGNGEEKSFEIESQSAKIFIIADKLSKNYCNEFYQLDEGEEDVFLSGQNKYNPITGNPFRFDNNENDVVIHNRKKNLKRGLIIFAVVAVVGFAVGFTISYIVNSRDETFSVKGMSITLPNEFEEVHGTDFTAAYGTEDVAVFALQEKFSLLEDFESYSLREYANMVKIANNISSSVKTAYGLTYFEYESTNPGTSDTFHYYAFVYKANDSFWLIQFAASDDVYEDYTEEIFDWAKSVEFDS